MIVTTEYEKKYLVPDHKKAQLLKYLGKPKTQKHQVDRYYDSNNAELFRRGIFIRIRGGLFQFKFNLTDVESGKSSGHTQCTEIELPLNIDSKNQKSLKKVLDSLGVNYPQEIGNPFKLFDYNGWKESIIINKYRYLFETPNYLICLDEIADLGSYIEIESSEKNPDITAEEKAIFSYINKHQFEYIDTGYNALFWKKANNSIYMKSPYIMKKDKNA